MTRKLLPLKGRQKHANSYRAVSMSFTNLRKVIYTNAAGCALQGYIITQKVHHRLQTEVDTDVSLLLLMTQN
jgi:hypothetical protein